MKIRAKIILGLSAISCAGAISGYLQSYRAEQSMESINNFSHESIPELMSQHNLSSMVDDLMLSWRSGKDHRIDSIYRGILTELDRVEQWEQEDEKYETLVNNSEEELKLFKETKELLTALYKAGSKGFKNGETVNNEQSLIAQQLWTEFSHVSLQRMKSEILEFHKNQGEAQRILDTTQREASILIISTLILALIIGLITANSVTKPLKILTSGIKELIDTGQLKEVKVVASDETRELASSFNTMITNLDASFKAKEKLNAELTSSNQILVEKNGKINAQKEFIALQYNQLKKVKAELQDVNNNLEYKVKERTDELYVKIIELNKAMSELDQFVYSASHDLGAPLKSILGLLNLTKLEKDPKKMNLYFDRIHNSILRLDDVIKDLIDFTRNARTEIKTSPESLQDMIDHSTSQLSYLEGIKTIRIETKLDSLPVVETDAQRLKIILRNLIGNAIKYQDLHKTEQYVRIESKKMDHTWYIDIIDNGIGIDKKYVTKVFDMFFRATDESHGSGLGLYIVKEKVQKLGGQISVRSEKNIGTHFRISFPVKEPYSDSIIARKVS